ncbi:hypothetical protein [Adhaeretor mobilis]|uniref:Uncharacterized protein n=1 Tax=Adhaeretor mobilis TaxID=1930276 RepID=A0A517MQ35_9BACT|nr:hypothetical protein [Adhaeretor mobilis]QDS96991.1 hypothetical protein HG15A2_02500 [Adhaeretor mobilis]
MLLKRYRIALLAIACMSISIGFTDTTFAQRRSSTSAVLGRGIHSYFDGQSYEAERQLTSAISAGVSDPLAFYFRGLSRLSQGRQFEAEQDFQIGAALEARNSPSGRGISRALTRVQGVHRRTLEKFRRQGRLTNANAATQEAQAKYRKLTTRETYVLRKPVELPVAQLLEPSSVEIVTPDSQVMPGTYVESAPVQPAISKPSLEESPFGEPVSEPVVAQPSKDVANKPVPTAESAAPSPFEPSPAPAAPVTVDSGDALFGDSEPAKTAVTESTPLQPVPQPVPAPQPEPVAEPHVVANESDEDPFSAPEPTEMAKTPADDLFGAPAESETPEADDLFGEPETVEPDSSTPAETDMSAEDPFSSDEPSEPEAADDLFGESEPDESAEPTPADVASEKPSPIAEATTAKITLPESSKVESGKLLGVLGKVAGGLLPKPNIELPKDLPPFGQGAPGPGDAGQDAAPDAGFELGPDTPAGEPLPAPAAPQPAAAPEDDLFGDIAEETDPFGEEAEMAEPEPEAAEPKETESEKVLSGEEEVADEQMSEKISEGETDDEATEESFEESESDVHESTTEESEDDPFDLFE